jgi:hypothetical protein
LIRGENRFKNQTMEDVHEKDRLEDHVGTIVAGEMDLPSTVLYTLVGMRYQTVRRSSLYLLYVTSLI